MILHSAKYKGEIHGLGFAGDNRVFVIGLQDVVVMDVAAGETVRTIPMVQEERRTGRRMAALSAYQKVGKLLYVADSRPHSASRSWTWKPARSSMKWATATNGSPACKWSATRRSCAASTCSYGIDNPQFGWFDLKTKKYADLKHPDAKFSDRVAETDFDKTTLVAGPDAGVCLAWKGTVYQFDGEGRQVGATPLDKDDDGRLVGVWNGQALTAGKDSLRLTPLAKATAKSD